jgi:hypothetical protein
MSTPSSSGVYAQGGGLLVLITAATVEQTGLVAGNTYEFVAIDGGALVKWGAADATIADGGFDSAVPKNGGPFRAVVPAGITAINVIESDAGSVATAALLVSKVVG